MIPYKLKHIPTGLYYQPYKHMGSNWSKRGKIYQTKSNILSIGYYNNGSPRKSLWIYAHENTLIYKEFKDKLDWQNSYNNQHRVETFACEWIQEEVKIGAEN